MTGQEGVASMGDRSQYDEALHRVDASDYQWQEHGSKGSLREAAVAQTHALLAVADELRRLNEGRDQFHREVLEVLTAASEPKSCSSTKRGAQPVVGDPHVHKCVLDRGHAGKHASSHDSEGLRWS